MGVATVSIMSLGMKIAELILGLICFVLFTYFGIIVCPGAVVISRNCWVRYNLSVISAVAYPFIIQLILIISTAANAEAYVQTLVDPLFTIVGFVVFVTSGSIQVYYADYYDSVPLIATGAVFIITGLVYLVDFILGLTVKKGQGTYDLGPQPPLESSRL